MNVLRKIIDWVKGEQYNTDQISSTETFEGTIPPAGCYSEESYRMRVDKHCVTTSWDCEWVKPTKRYYCVVNPLTTHKLPVDVRCKTIIISDPLLKESFATEDPEEALAYYLQHIVNQRAKFQRSTAN